MAANPFAKVSMNPGKVKDVLVATGVVDLDFREVKPGKQHHYSGNFDGQKFLINIYINGDGKCTVGKAVGYDENVFLHLADKIVQGCRWGAVAKLELSLHKFEPKKREELVEFLTSLGAQIVAKEKGSNYELTRIKGPNGDTIACKAFSNGTLQLQGTHAQVAVWTLDFLRTTLSLEELLEHQRKAYELPSTVEETKRELEERIPNIHAQLQDEIRIQLSSALALTKVAVELEDYAALAFPALRGLEGFCFQLLRDECGFHPPKKAQLGDYFEKTAGIPEAYAMRSPHRDTVAEYLQKLLEKCYTTWHNQRHRLFHMDGTVETTRIMENRADAISLVDEVFVLIDQGYVEYLKAKP